LKGTRFTNGLIQIKKGAIRRNSKLDLNPLNEPSQKVLLSLFVNK